MSFRDIIKFGRTGPREYRGLTLQSFEVATPSTQFNEQTTKLKREPGYIISGTTVVTASELDALIDVLIEAKERLIESKEMMS